MGNSGIILGGTMGNFGIIDCQNFGSPSIRLKIGVQILLGTLNTKNTTAWVAQGVIPELLTVSEFWITFDSPENWCADAA